MQRFSARHTHPQRSPHDSSMHFAHHIKSLLRQVRTPTARFFYAFTLVNLLIVVCYQTVSTCQSSICWSMRSPPCFVVTIPKHERRAKRVVHLFKKYAQLDLRLFYGVNGNVLYQAITGQRLLPGELGLRDSMKNLFTLAVKRNYNDMFVFEDDAIPHRNFTALFRQLPKRCREADVLLLGAIVTSTGRRRWPFGPCFDATRRTYGSHALYVKKSAFVPILDWLTETSIGPFDTVYGHLRYQKMIVRVAHSPFLSIQDHSHPSSVNAFRSIDRMSPKQRAMMHHWNLDEYPVAEMSASA